MTGKLLAVIFLCAFIAIDARPNRGRGGGHGEGPHPHDGTQPVEEAGKELMGLQRLCDGLESGNITNDNSSYDAVFESLNDVCLALAAYQEAQSVASDTDAADPVAPADPVVSARRKRSPRGGSQGGSRGGSKGGAHEKGNGGSGRNHTHTDSVDNEQVESARRKRSPRGGSQGGSRGGSKGGAHEKGNGGSGRNHTHTDSVDSEQVESARRKRSPRGGSSGESHEKGQGSSDSDHTHTAVEMLFRICGGVTRVLANLPTDMAADLVSIYQNMGAVCAAAELVRNPQ